MLRHDMTDSPSPLTPCPVRGHSHNLVVVREITQKGTGNKAAIVECPSGDYRWLVLEGRTVAESLRFKRPRWGWKS